LNRSKFNIILFGIVTSGCGFLGNAINSLYHPQDTMQSLGVLIWLVSPLAANLLLRSFAGDGWKDLGIQLNLRKGWKWYLTALLVVPLISLMVIGLGLLTGFITAEGFTSKGFQPFILLTGSAFAGTMVKNVFEEFAWRGYLTPRLEAMKSNPIINSMVTGLIWAAWHIPYYLYFLSPEVIKSQTSLSVPALILMSFLILPVQALAYGELRLLSKSVWPDWLLHTTANAVSFALVTVGFITISGGLPGFLLTPGTEGIFYTILLGLLGWMLYLKRTRQSRDI
jgi:membrane protease YdiL (CAAX protease family)